MVHVLEKCLRSLNQEPGGSVCVMYSYRTLEKSTQSLLRLKDGIAVIEMLSDHRLNPAQIAKIYGIEPDLVTIDREDQFPDSAKNNPVPG